MTLDVSIHKTILFQVLKELYSNPLIGPYIGFKGGTAAVLYYGLDRFSVDLDFDLLDDARAETVFTQISKILGKYGSVKESYMKRFNLFFLLSYELHAHNIKIEISRRSFGSQYELKTHLGVSMVVMTKEDMFAHKMMAMSERMGKTSRDIYDVWYFLNQRFPINKNIIEQRSQLSFDQFLQSCIDRLAKVHDRNILDGVGELLSQSQKDWAKAKLKEETIALLHLRME